MGYQIIRDTREQQGYFFTAHESCEGTVIAKLDTGDYTLKGWEHLVCIERKKSIGELYNNITEKRFTAELERMVKIPYSFIVVEASFQDVMSFPMGSGIPERFWPKLKCRQSFLLARLCEIQVKYRIPIIYCGNKTAAWAYTRSLVKRLYECLKEP